MSFILDALKKSELERQRQSVPGLVDSDTVRPPAKFPKWAIFLGVLLAVNLLVLLFVLTRGSMSTPHAPPAAAAAAPEPAAAGRHFSPLSPQPMYAPEIPAGDPAAGDPAAGDMATRAPVHIAPPALAASSIAKPASPGSSGSRTSRADPLLSGDDYKAGDDEMLPTINEISLTGAQALPELHLDVHVFATKSAERFVYVNMRKYHEGATLQEGPTIERIRRDGVILSYQGLRFLLPRQ